MGGIPIGEGARPLDEIIVGLHETKDFSTLNLVLAGYGGAEPDLGRRPLGLAEILISQLPFDDADVWTQGDGISRLRHVAYIMEGAAKDPALAAWIDDDRRMIRAELDRRAPNGIFDPPAGEDGVTTAVATGGIGIIASSGRAAAREVIGRSATRQAERVAAESATAAEAATVSSISRGTGFRTFEALKRHLGSPGAGNHWHHIVGQTRGNLQRFGAETIHNTGNVIAIPASIHIGKGSISAYYSSVRPFTDGLTVRTWLSTQSLQQQRAFGLQVLRDYGY